MESIFHWKRDLNSDFRSEFSFLKKINYVKKSLTAQVIPWISVGLVLYSTETQTPVSVLVFRCKMPALQRV